MEPPQIIGSPDPNFDEVERETGLQRESSLGPETPRSVDFNDLIQELGKEVAKMDVKDPELLRATLASSALSCFGQVLHKKFHGDMYPASFQTEDIDCFWSHSWHGLAWEKILLLMLLYNGRVSLVVGNLAAMLGMALFFAGLLPAYPRTFSIEGATYDFGPWGLTFGSIATLSALVLGRPGSKVFVDRICIHQSDEMKKSMGVLSIGGIIKHSKTMLVLWDPSYSTRLWTTFELAAFLKSHGESGLIVRPTFLATASVAVSVFGLLMNLCNVVVSIENATGALLTIAGLMLMILVIGGAGLRKYFRWVDQCSLQLADFSMAAAKAHCCTINHVDEFGVRTLCDREVIAECVCSWFGSVKEFEESVKGRVTSTLMKSLGRHAFPFSWFMGINCQTIWAFTDLVIARLRAEEYYFALLGLINMLVTSLVSVPLLYVLCLCLAFKLRRPRGHPCLDFLVSFLGALGVLVVALGLSGIRLIFAAVVEDDLLGMTLWALVSAVVAASAWRMWMVVT